MNTDGCGCADGAPGRNGCSSDPFGAAPEEDWNLAEGGLGPMPGRVMYLDGGGGRAVDPVARLLSGSRDLTREDLIRATRELALVGVITPDQAEEITAYALGADDIIIIVIAILSAILGVGAAAPDMSSCCNVGAQVIDLRCPNGTKGVRTSTAPGCRESCCGSTTFGVELDFPVGPAN